MRILNEQEKRDLLQQILRELSKSQDVLKDSKNRVEYFLRLESIYYNTDSDNFRHYYSDIFACLTLIDGDSEIGNLDILAQNMQTIKDGYLPKNLDDHGSLIDISKEILKLYDHTNLDISRINYTKRMAGETLSELAKAKLLINDLQEELQKSEQDREKAIESLKTESKKLKDEVREGQQKMQNEYITILGIFAAIVLAFTGGLTFSTSVLENIDKVSTYRLIAIVLVLALVFYNIVWLLIDFLRDINGKTIRKWWIVLLVNGLIILGFLLSILAYKNRWFDRDSVSSKEETQIVNVLEDDKSSSGGTESFNLQE